MVYDLSRVAMKLARMGCGSKDGRVGGSIPHPRGFWTERVPIEVLGGCQPDFKVHLADELLHMLYLRDAALHRLTELELDLHQVLVGLLSSSVI